MVVLGYFLQFSICCGYSLEASRGGTSNKYHSICLLDFYGGK